MPHRSDRQPSHVIILPYYCEEEIERYLKVAACLKRFGTQSAQYRFLLAASPRIAPSRRLHEAFAQIAPVVDFSCPTQISGYPQGPTAMFWDCMEHIAQTDRKTPGFGLWLESDMAIVKPDWLDRLSAEWMSRDRTPLMMGCFVPNVYRRRIFRGRKHILHAHINGGACYAKDFAVRMPPEARQGVFDMSVYPHVAKAGGAKLTKQICFSTVSRARRDVMHPDKVILHGFMQEKDQFIERCTAPITPREELARVLHPILDRVEDLGRRCRVMFVRRGPRAMLENMLLAQENQSRRAA